MTVADCEANEFCICMYVGRGYCAAAERYRRGISSRILVPSPSRWSDALGGGAVVLVHMRNPVQVGPAPS